MSKHLTVCPDCGVDYDTTNMDTDMPIQHLTQQCPECETTVAVGIINYANNEFTVVGPALDDEQCRAGSLRNECGDNAVIRIQRVGDNPQGRCVEHAGAHHDRARQHADDVATTQ